MIDLPHELNGGNWRIGLCEISYFKSKTFFPSVDVLCDSIVSNFENAQSSQILRRIQPGKGDISRRFNPIFYSDVITPNIKSLTVYLRANSKEDAAFKDTPVYCTLHLLRND